MGVWFTPCGAHKPLEEKPKPGLWRPDPAFLAAHTHPPCSAWSPHSHLHACPRPLSLCHPPLQSTHCLFLSLNCLPSGVSPCLTLSGAAITHCHRPGGLNTDFSHSSQDWKSRVRLPAAGSGEGRLLGLQTAAFSLSSYGLSSMSAGEDRGEAAFLVCSSVYCLFPVPTLRYKEGIWKNMKAVRLGLLTMHNRFTEQGLAE